MNNIEEDLKRALRRQDPPSDLVGKVMGRVASGEGLEPESQSGSKRILAFRPKGRVMVWVAAAAAACLIGLFVTRSYIAEPGKIPSPGFPPVTAMKSEPNATPGVPSNQDTTGGTKHSENNPNINLVGGHSGVVHHSAGGSYHRRTVSQPLEAEARQAEQQLKLALGIISAKLGYAQRSIQEADGTGNSDRDVNR